MTAFFSSTLPNQVAGKTAEVVGEKAQKYTEEAKKYTEEAKKLAEKHLDLALQVGSLSQIEKLYSHSVTTTLPLYPALADKNG